MLETREGEGEIILLSARKKVEITQAQNLPNLFADCPGNPSLVGRRRRMDLLPFSVEDHREREKAGKRKAEFYL